MFSQNYNSDVEEDGSIEENDTSYFKAFFDWEWLSRLYTDLLV